MKNLGRLDIVVNNAAVQYVHSNISEITEKELDDVFGTNIYAMFYMVQVSPPRLFIWHSYIRAELTGPLSPDDVTS